MAKIFQALVWPAVAGNVLWALFALLVIGPAGGGDFGARVALLACLAAYLAIEWLATEGEADRLKRFYWVADLFSAVGIIVLAIATQQGERWLDIALAFVFLVASIGHLSKAWQPKDVEDSYARQCALPAALNMIGLVVLFAISSSAYNGAIALGIVALLWIGLRTYIYADRSLVP